MLNDMPFSVSFSLPFFCMRKRSENLPFPAFGKGLYDRVKKTISRKQYSSSFYIVFRLTKYYNGITGF